jgi:LysM repeat protein
LLIGTIGLNQSSGCGPDFPNWLLALGDKAVLVAPEGNFASELARMNLGRPRVLAIPAEESGGYTAQSIGAELGDLRRALKQAGKATNEVTRICDEHENQRRLLAGAVEAHQSWDDSNPVADAQADAGEQPRKTKPLFPNVVVTDGLPDEFADYFEGFVAWHNPTVTDKQNARAAWERLLARPEEERRYKSTWAAFMLGKSWEESDPDKALDYFKHVRELAKQGYRDSLGLAAASLGLEARVYLAQKNYEAAIESYLDQLASGDPSATNSLATAAAGALSSGAETLRSLARNPRTQKVITAYLICRPTGSSFYGEQSHEDSDGPKPAEVAESPAAAWLKATEQAQIKDMDSAEALALAAYRANSMDQASRWIKRAPGSPVAQWLQAKLLLRAGKLQSAAALLARVSTQFPIVHEGTNAPAPVERKDTLTVDGNYYFPTSAERQVHGELGVLRLSRGEYVEALDSLLNAGFWMDAAYVAERVLTTEELKGYVDHFWPRATADQTANEQERFGESEVCPAVLREKIRYLLARRLTRESNGDKARDYFPAAWLAGYDQLMVTLVNGWNETLQPPERASALFEAALITRTNGMELMGTEVGPDWHYHLGNYEEGVTGEDRSTNAAAVLVRPSNDELRRNAEHQPDPNRRFHYRYQAASLAWEAAKLLPNNSDQTAYVLWKGGSFLKYKDPQTADLFYKALVRRNRKTVLGAEADRERWFPTLDENGNIVPNASKVEEPSESSEPQDTAAPQPMEQNSGTEDSPVLVPPESAESEATPTQGYVYVVSKGNSLTSIAKDFTRAGVTITPAEILSANPGLDPARLLVGQKIFVPAKRE